MNLVTEERRFDSTQIIARPTEFTGWGLFAKRTIEEGETIFPLHLEDTTSSRIVRWIDSFGPCFDRGYTIVPDYGYCSTDDNPFWYMNHSCKPSAGFVNWSRIEKGAVPIVAFRRLRAGEQITADYATFTMRYDGTPDGGPFEYGPCLCGEPTCRHTITGFECLPHDLQMNYLLGTSHTPGRVLAHIVHDLPELEAEFRRIAPHYYEQYQSVLNSLKAKADEFRVRVGASRAPAPNGNGNCDCL